MPGASKTPRFSSWRALTLAVAAVMVLGCATPTKRVQTFALQNRLNERLVHGAEYEHVVFENVPLHNAALLHVYIEGDGTPYLNRWTVALDPTPRKPLMLHLMTRDPAPAVYVGRPCYFGLAFKPPCTPAAWTIGRFGEPVVESMARAIEQLQRERGARTLELYGHSGGGTLAVLLAARLSSVRRVVTLSANLDTTAWTKYHNYTPLSGSLNPVDIGPLPANIEQLHMAAGNDRVVPAWIVEKAARRLGDGEYKVLLGASHTCCWEQYWRESLGVY
jgi:pimeloyl-ACP methyl ester carboxylesterase